MKKFIAESSSKTIENGIEHFSNKKCEIYAENISDAETIAKRKAASWDGLDAYGSLIVYEFGE